MRAYVRIPGERTYPGPVCHLLRPPRRGLLGLGGACPAPPQPLPLPSALQVPGRPETAPFSLRGDASG